MKLVKVLIISLLPLFLYACGWGSGSYHTIEDLDYKQVDIENDIPVESSRKKAIYSYRELLIEGNENAKKPEVMRRLGDLRLEENEELNTVEALEPKVAKQFTTTKIDYKETISLYEDLIAGNPYYELSDAVLYQLSRAYESDNQREKMLDSLDRLIAKYPQSAYFIEAHFRRGEALFVDKKYRPAERSYSEVIRAGEENPFYRHALYKQGWSHFKLLDYDVGLHSFIALMDNMLDKGSDDEIDNLTRPEKELLDDTLRALGLSYAYLGGAKEVSGYFSDY